MTSYPSKKETFEWAKDKYPLSGNSGEYKVREQEFTPKAIEELLGKKYYGESSEGRYTPLRGLSASTLEDFGVFTYDSRAYKTSKGDMKLNNVQEYIYPNGGKKVLCLLMGVPIICLG